MRFSELKERLLRAGIAPRHVRRYMRELNDHFDDLKRAELANGASGADAETAARARLGSDEALAKVMLARPELKSWPARFPLTVFGLGPVVMLVLAVVGAILLEIGFVLSVRWMTGGTLATLPYGIKLLLNAWNLSAMYLIPLVIAGFICAIGLRQRIAASWIALGVASVCILGGFHQISLTPSKLSAGLGFAPPYPSIWADTVRSAINLAIAGLIYMLLRRREISIAE